MPNWKSPGPDLVQGFWLNSARNSSGQSAIVEGFAEANSVFIVITSAKICPGNYFVGKYIFSLQF